MAIGNDQLMWFHEFICFNLRLDEIPISPLHGNAETPSTHVIHGFSNCKDLETVEATVVQCLITTTPSQSRPVQQPHPPTPSTSLPPTLSPKVACTHYPTQVPS